MPVARINWRIEKHQRAPWIGILKRVTNRDQARQRMENPRDRLRSELALNRAQHAFQIGNKMRQVVPRGAVERILAVIANVEQNQVVSIAKQIPEWKIRIDREPIAMTQDEALAGGISMPAHADNRAIDHNEIEDPIWLRQLKLNGHAMVLLKHAHGIDIDREMNIR